MELKFSAMFKYLYFIQTKRSNNSYMKKAGIFTIILPFYGLFVDSTLLRQSSSQCITMGEEFVTRAWPVQTVYSSVTPGNILYQQRREKESAGRKHPWCFLMNIWAL